jgi:hypothetical protein
MCTRIVGQVRWEQRPSATTSKTDEQRMETPEKCETKANSQRRVRRLRILLVVGTPWADVPSPPQGWRTAGFLHSLRFSFFFCVSALTANGPTTSFYRGAFAVSQLQPPHGCGQALHLTLGTQFPGPYAMRRQARCSLTDSIENPRFHLGAEPKTPHKLSRAYLQSTKPGLRMAKPRRQESASSCSYFPHRFPTPFLLGLFVV